MAWSYISDHSLYNVQFGGKLNPISGECSVQCQKKSLGQNGEEITPLRTCPILGYIKGKTVAMPQFPMIPGR